MKKQTCWFVAGAGAVALGAACFLVMPGRGGAADAPGSVPAIPDSERLQLVEQSIKTIESALKDKPGKPDLLRARTAAIMIAAVAQYGPAGATTPKQVALRDMALGLAAAIKDDRLDQAKIMVQALKTTSGGGKAGKLKILPEKIELEEFMGQFASPRSGGLGIEKVLEDLEDAKTLPADSLGDLLLIADRSTVVAEMIRGLDKEKKQKQWDGFADAMGKHAAELAAAARTKNADATLKAAQVLSKSCNDCHVVFK